MPMHQSLLLSSTVSQLWRSGSAYYSEMSFHKYSIPFVTPSIQYLKVRKLLCCTLILRDKNKDIQEFSPHSNMLFLQEKAIFFRKHYTILQN
jgi:hypothetical protein